MNVLKFLAILKILFFHFDFPLIFWWMLMFKTENWNVILCVRSILLMIVAWTPLFHAKLPFILPQCSYIFRAQLSGEHLVTSILQRRISSTRFMGCWGCFADRWGWYRWAQSHLNRRGPWTLTERIDRTVGESLGQWTGRGERRHRGFLHWIQQRGRKAKTSRWVDRERWFELYNLLKRLIKNNLWG